MKCGEEYFKKHLKHKHLRYESNKKFEDHQLIFGCGLATGGSAIGIGDTTEARRFIGESKRVRDNINCDEAFEHSCQDPSWSRECDISPPFQGTNPKGRMEKLPSRKRPRTLAISNVDKLKIDKEDPMIIVSNRILNVIQQREERQQREAERKSKTGS